MNTVPKITTQENVLYIAKLDITYCFEPKQIHR